MGRRRFVKTLVAAGFSLATASHLSAGDFAGVSEDEVPIVYAIARDDPAEPASLSPRVRLVPAGWYNDLQAVLSTHATLELDGIDGVFNAYVVPGNYGGRDASIAVDVDSEEVATQVADLTGEIPVESSIIDAVVGEDSEGHPPRNRYDLDAGTAIPGGVAIGNATGVATLTPALYDTTAERRFFATAAHLYADGESDELAVLSEGEGDRHTLGQVHHRHRTKDLAVIRPTGGFSPAHAIYGANPTHVAGQFSRIGLADLKARGEEIHKVGAMSGHTSGTIQAIDGVTCVYGDPCKRGQLKWGEESDFADGDSGSVSYAPDPENPDEQVLVCGLNNARTWWPGENYVWGTGAYVFHEEYGYTF